MRWIYLLLLLFSIAGAEETVYLKSGKFQKGKLISQTDESLTFEFKKVGVAGLSRVKIPWRSVEKIVFPSSVKQIDALGNPVATDLGVFVELWEKNAPWISRPESKAAEIGLAYATKLANSEAEMAAEQALDLFDHISKTAWDPADQAAGLRGRLRTLLKTGRERDAIREAEALAEETENPALLLEAKYILASNDFEKLQAIVEENPRWELDDEIRPERNRYFNSAIDHSLFAYLFFGSEEQAAAKGLALAAEIYQFASDLKNARRCADDILKLYPETFASKQATELLSKLPSEPSE
ncbi:MAG: hypothetical protein P1U89_02785 [Verrucomicrobiales bacterium]|nr:hypothetical protein [Verrucomicrobiales bacterium]